MISESQVEYDWSAIYLDSETIEVILDINTPINEENKAELVIEFLEVQSTDGEYPN